MNELNMKLLKEYCEKKKKKKCDYEVLVMK